MRTFANKRNSKAANAATKESRVVSLRWAVDGIWRHRLCDEFLVRPGSATRADFIEALACESDSSRIDDLKLWQEARSRSDAHRIMVSGLTTVIAFRGSVAKLVEKVRRRQDPAS
jgi:hypothetical protein